MTLILPIALVGGGAILALALYGFYQRSLSQMWERHYGDAYSDNLRLTDARNQAQTDLAHAKDEIATLEAERDDARAQRDRLNERCAQLSAQLAERDGRIRQLEHGRDGIVAALGITNNAIEQREFTDALTGVKLTVKYDDPVHPLIAIVRPPALDGDQAAAAIAYLLEEAGLFTPPVEPTPGVRTIDTSAPAPVAAGSDGEPVYYVTPKAERKPTPRKRGNGKATGEAVKE